MTSAERRPIAITNDIDGVHVRAPIPMTTLRKLLLRRYHVPAEVFEVLPYSSPTGVVGRGMEAITSFTHRNRRIDPRGSEGLRMMHETALANHREVVLMVLSGRIKPVHEATIHDLGPTYNGQFERWLLNESTSSSDWKEYQGRKLTEEGFTVLHIDDDLNPALKMARVGNVFVYLFRNFSNSPYLLRWAGVELPENVIAVRGFEEANVDFSRRLLSGLI